jgi:hypothetical protein
MEATAGFRLSGLSDIIGPPRLITDVEAGLARAVSRLVLGGGGA